MSGAPGFYNIKTSVGFPGHLRTRRRSMDQEFFCLMSERTCNLVRYVVPTMLGSCCFFLFTIVDGIFVGHGIGMNALGAVNLTMPFVMIVNALFMLTTIGGNTVIAIRLGRQDVKGANQAFMHALTGTLVISAALSLAGCLLTAPICRLLGANDTFFAMTGSYLFWYSIFIIPAGLSTALQGFCRNDGSPVLVSAAIITGTVCNIIGDWLFIFPLKAGLAGAAAATGISQTITLLILLLHFRKTYAQLHFCRFLPAAELVGKVFKRGLPECIAQFATPVTTLCINYVLISKLGDVAVNAYSIISYVAAFSVAIFFGTAEGLQPLFGHCYGEKNENDLKFYFRAGLLINFIGSLLVNILLCVFASDICRLFGASGETLRVTRTALPLYSWGFVVMSFNSIISAYLYSTKRSKQSDIINILRGFVMNTAVILLLPVIFGNGIIWHTFGIYELAVLLIAVLLLRCSERNGIVFR